VTTWALVCLRGFADAEAVPIVIKENSISAKLTIINEKGMTLM
jgi:hypothetical protein